MTKTICVVLGKNEHHVLSLLSETPATLEELRNMVNNDTLRQYSSLAVCLLRLIKKKFVSHSTGAVIEFEKFFDYHFKQKVAMASNFTFAITEIGKDVLGLLEKFKKASLSPSMSDPPESVMYKIYRDKLYKRVSMNDSYQWDFVETDDPFEICRILRVEMNGLEPVEEGEIDCSEECPVYKQCLKILESHIE